MNITEIIFEKSLWYIALCILLAGLFSFFLYQKKNTFSRNVNLFLAFTRFTLVFLIAMLLLVPMIKQVQNLIEKPIIVLALDNSESMFLNDSTKVKTLIKNIESTQNQFIDKGYEVELITFDNNSNKNLSEVNFDTKNTNLGSFLKGINSSYENRNLVATILISDGINNTGISPEYLNFETPIYTLGIGDTTFKEDIFIKNVFVNKIAYKDNLFPIKIEIGNKVYKGKQQKVLLQYNNKIVETQIINFNSFSGVNEVTFFVKAENIGKQLFKIELPAQSGETNLINNQKDIFIDVVDGKQKILLLALAPHPDIKAINEVITQQKNYELDIKIGEELSKAVLGKYDLVIFHQIPNKLNIGTQLLEQFKNDSKWFITGSKTDYKKLNNIQKSVQFSINSNQIDNVFPAMNMNQDKFIFEKELSSTITEFPPIVVPFGDINVSNATSILIKQKVGSIETEKPLLCVGNENELKNVFFIGEGLWRWRMLEFVRNENTTAFDKLISKTIQFAANKNDKRKLRVYPIANEFLENENVLIDVEVYNDVFEKVYNKEIVLTLANEERKLNFKFINSESNSRFSLGNLKKGIYNFEASTVVNGKTEKVNGQFVVQKMDLEAISTTADFNLLRKIALNNQGAFYLDTELETLNQKLLSENHLSKIISSYEELNELLHQKWIFFLLLLLITLEWSFRKYFGSI